MTADKRPGFHRRRAQRSAGQGFTPPGAEIPIFGLSADGAAITFSPHPHGVLVVSRIGEASLSILISDAHARILVSALVKFFAQQKEEQEQPK